jgi:hypothetical protein
MDVSPLAERLTGLKERRTALGLATGLAYAAMAKASVPISSIRGCKEPVSEDHLG